jgi:hypothetical protein
MSFWDLSDGQTAVDTPKEYEVPGGSMEPIPNNSDVLAIVDQAKWADKDGAAYVELRWAVMAPEAVKGRKVFHKLWVTDLDPNAKDEAKGKAKRDKARRMLASIDANAGGNLTRTGEAPTDETLTMHLCNKPMVIKVMVWSMKGSDGTDMAGNWVSAVSPSDKPLQISSEPLPKTSAAPAPYQGGNSDVGDDEIPF